jgi:RNA polymerase sigma factor (sigma-70 family)
VGDLEPVRLDDREDLVGVVMEKYHKQWGRGAGTHHLGAWLKAVVEGSIADELRRRAVRPRLADLPEDPDDGVPFEEMLVSLVTPSAQTYYTKLLDDALRELGNGHPDDPSLILQKYAEGLEIAEIASWLQVSEETAKKRVQRASTRLRAIVARLAGSAGL